MAISDRQAAAIQRRKRQRRVDQALAEDQRRMSVVMLPADDDTATDPDLVGWAIFTVSLSGDGHQCIRCSPTRPGLAFGPVARFRLAARRPCRTCGTVLEAIEKK